MKHTTVRQAIKLVSDNPRMLDDNLLTKPTHELVCRELFTIANSGDATVRGSMARANKAREMILNRLGGKRRAGTAPVTKGSIAVEFRDLTGGELDGPAAGEPVGQDQ